MVKPMHISEPAILCSTMTHGETGAIVRLLTERQGLVGAYVRGGRSRRLRPILLPGNLVQAAVARRSPGQLATATIELVTSRAPLMFDRIAAAGLEWTTGLVATTLAEDQPYPALFDGLSALLTLQDAAQRASQWLPAMVRFELLLLRELGYGLDLSACALTGTTQDLTFVSPRSGRAVSEGAAGGYRDRLLPLPAFLREGTHDADWAALADALKLTGHFLARSLLHARRSEGLLTVRDRIVAHVEELSRPAAR